MLSRQKLSIYFFWVGKSSIAKDIYIDIEPFEHGFTPIYCMVFFMGIKFSYVLPSDFGENVFYFTNSHVGIQPYFTNHGRCL